MHVYSHGAKSALIKTMKECLVFSAQWVSCVAIAMMHVLLSCIFASVLIKECLVYRAEAATSMTYVLLSYIFASVQQQDIWISRLGEHVHTETQTASMLICNVYGGRLQRKIVSSTHLDCIGLPHSQRLHVHNLSGVAIDAECATARFGMLSPQFGENPALSQHQILVYDIWLSRIPLACLCSVWTNAKVHPSVQSVTLAGKE